MAIKQRDIKRANVQTILKRSQAVNLCDEIDDNELVKIGRDAVKFSRIDDDSRAEWLAKSEKAMEAALQVVKQKNTPWPNASNVKYPLLTVAALQFNARAYPAIIQGNKVVRPFIVGSDPTGQKKAQGERVADHLNYQLLFDNEDWESDVDRMLLALPIEGCEFKKTYFSKDLGRNVSELIAPKDLIVHNKTKSLETCPRITHRLFFYPYEISERQQSGVWLGNVNLQLTEDDYDQETLQEFYEQHCGLDLDDDGYKEPYIVTVHVKTQQVVRVAPNYYDENVIVRIDGEERKLSEFAQMLANADLDVGREKFKSAKLVRIEKNCYFTKFEFFPAPDKSFYGIGFGQLVGPITDSIDTNINQLIDAGTAANNQGGFIRDGVSISGQRGSLKFTLGEFKRVKLPTMGSISDSIFQMKFAEPSMVLFQLLGFLVQTGKEITGIQDIMVGAPASPNEPAATTLARIDQGLKVFSAIYKRIYRSLRSEYRKLYKLNARYLKPEEYFVVLDSGEASSVTLDDYRHDGTNVMPIADPQFANNLISVVKAQALMALKGDPSINPDEINRLYIESLEIPGGDNLIIPPVQRPKPGPDPIITLEAMKAASKHEETQAKIVKMYSEVMKNLADAESTEQGTQLEQYKAQLEDMIRQWGANEQGSADQNNTGGPVPMEAAPGNQGGVSQAAPIPTGMF